MADTNDRNSIIEGHKKAINLEAKRNIGTVIKAINDRIAQLRAKIAKLDICIKNYEESQKESESGKIPSPVKPKSLECMDIKNINGAIGEKTFEIDLNNEGGTDETLYQSEDFQKFVRKINFEKLKSDINEIKNAIQAIGPEVQTFDHVSKLTEEFIKNCEKYNWHNPKTKKTIFEEEQYDEFMKMIRILMGITNMAFTPEGRRVPRENLVGRNKHHPLYIGPRFTHPNGITTHHPKYALYIKLGDNKILTSDTLELCKANGFPYFEDKRSFKEDNTVVFLENTKFIKLTESIIRLMNLIDMIYEQIYGDGNYPTRGEIEPSNLIYENPNYTVGYQPKKCSGECPKNNVRDLLDTKKDTDSAEVHESALQVKEELRAKIKKLEEKLDELLLNEADRLIGK